MESQKVKRERFIKIAEARTNKIIDMIRLLGNCSNKNNYSYTKEEVKKIYDTIERELKLSKSRFDNSSKDARFTIGGDK